MRRKPTASASQVREGLYFSRSRAASRASTKDSKTEPATVLAYVEADAWNGFGGIDPGAGVELALGHGCPHG